MYKILVNSCNEEVTYFSDIDLYNIFSKNKEMSDFPELKIYNGISRKSEYKIIYKNSLERILLFEGKKIIVKYPFEEMDNGRTIFYLGYSLIEYQRAFNKCITCHSACISLNNNGILLFGKEGAGKTTTAISLCLNYNAKLIANDLCVLEYKDINKINSIGGTKFLFLRYESIKRNLPQLLNLFKKECDDSWLNKKKVMPNELGIITKSDKTQIKNIFILHIDNLQEKLFIKNADTVINRLYLNENLSRYIRNTCTAMLGTNNILLDYIPSLDKKEFYYDRQKLINYFFYIGVEYISGNIRDVSNYIYSKSVK